MMSFSIAWDSRLFTEDPQQEDYGREIPVRKQTDRHTGPPILPPQLLQVILNKDVSEHVCITKLFGLLLYQLSLSCSEPWLAILSAICV